MVSFKHKGDFSKTIKFLGQAAGLTNLVDFDKYGQAGVAALALATPTDTGLTASSWSYKITKRHDSVTIEFTNSNVQNGVPIAIILQYGHATRNGGWVEGTDYINPAIRPIFDKIVDDAWKEVTKS